MLEAFIQLCKVDLLPYNYIIQAAQEIGFLLKNVDASSSFEECFPLWANAARRQRSSVHPSRVKLWDIMMKWNQVKTFSFY